VGEDAVAIGSDTPTRKPPTLADVAESAGVSVATVSRALSKPHLVQGETYEKVMHAVEELGYEPRKKYAPTSIGLIAPPDFPEGRVFGNYVGGIIHGADKYCARNDLVLSLVSVDTPLMHHMVSTYRMAGLLYLNIFIEDAQREQLLAQPRLRTVLVGYPPEDVRQALHSSLTWVTIDDAGAAREAVRYLMSLGHRRIGIIQGDERHVSNERRLGGVRGAFSEQGVEIPGAPLQSGDFEGQDGFRALIEWGDYETESGFRAMTSLLERREPPTAVFAFNDLMAFGAMQAVNESGLEVPRDVSLIGCDDIIARFLRPELTTVHQPAIELGEMAARVLVDLAAGARVVRSQLEARLIIRESCAPPSR
jgi:LacI family repressor for deo operon, udp, cdd, tsx, nupC, and nupG